MLLQRTEREGMQTRRVRDNGQEREARTGLIGGGLGMLTRRRKDLETPEERPTYQVTPFPSLGTVSSSVK